MRQAFTRAVSPRLAECELTHLERRPIDLANAIAQHRAYERVLAAAGFGITRLPELADQPDAVFVEDTALLLDGEAVILRPGAAPRAAETETTAAVLAQHYPIHRLDRGSVDGGDILRIGSTLYVGRSTRTDADGIGALADCAGPLGYNVVSAVLGDCLHLKTGATFAGFDRAGNPVLLYSAASVDPGQFAEVEPLAVDPAEPGAANCVRAGDSLILAAGNPRTAARLRRRGFAVIEVDIAEFAKAEAGVSCMSLIDDRL